MSEMTPEPTSQELQPALPPAPVATYLPHHPTPNFARRVAAAVVVAVILATGGGIGAGWSLARFIDSHYLSSSTQAHLQTVQPIQQDTSSGNSNLNLNGISRKVSPAVVDVNTVIQTASGSAAAAGTGLIISSSGNVLTNNHVVEGSVSIKVTIQGRSGTYTATVIGVDPTDDVAVIHVNGVSGLPTVTIADSSSVTVGDTVYALGNALGLGGAPRVTQGSITALDQTITASDNGAQAEQLTGMIQTDAEISPGDSGGALVNSAGQVIGIITAGQAQGFRSTSTTIAFAIPSSKAVEIANRILAGQSGNGVYIGPVGYLGVSVQTLDATNQAQLGVSISSGAYVRSVVAGSPADRAGITAGSVITQVNSTVVDSATALGDALHKHRPGDHVKVTWVVGGATHAAEVTLVSGPAI
ncbi:MAG TPA: trypsin-like peptidase domain-containing protein [Candidatus Dormibacteraeota bacterium]|nr:trypsin-like peptidase domain-containing protein [Candidatus Dormibacteraeota bacterium]